MGLFTKKQAEEDIEERYGLNWITMEMAQKLGLADTRIQRVAFPKEFIHMVVEMKSKGRTLKVNEY